MNPYCSTGAFITRRNNRDYTLIPSQAALLNWKEFEFMLFSDWYPKLDEVLDFLNGCGLAFPAVHAEKNITSLLAGDSSETNKADALLRENCRAAKSFGAFIVLHLWHGTHTADVLDHLLTDGIDRVRDIAGETGIEILIENTPSATGSVLCYLERIMQRHPSQRFTIDTRHTTFQGEADTLLDADWLWPNVRHIHMSDYKGPAHEFASISNFCAPGEGNVQLERWFQFLRDIRYAGSITMESNSAGPQGIEDVAMLTNWLTYIRDSIPAETRTAP